MLRLTRVKMKMILENFKVLLEPIAFFCWSVAKQVKTNIQIWLKYLEKMNALKFPGKFELFFFYKKYHLNFFPKKFLKVFLRLNLRRFCAGKNFYGYKWWKWWSSLLHWISVYSLFNVWRWKLESCRSTKKV